MTRVPKLDTSKTQLLIDKLPDGSEVLRKFKRRHTLMLFRNGLPVKPITHKEFNEIPREIVRLEMLHTDWMWLLIEIP